MKKLIFQYLLNKSIFVANICFAFSFLTDLLNGGQALSWVGLGFIFNFSVAGLMAHWETKVYYNLLYVYRALFPEEEDSQENDQ